MTDYAGINEAVERTRLEVRHLILTQGAAAERSCIVAWLREQGETADGWIPDLVRVADAIERGDHASTERRQDSREPPDLPEMIRRADAAYQAMTTEQRAAHDAAQRESFARANVAIDRPPPAPREGEDGDE